MEQRDTNLLPDMDADLEGQAQTAAQRTTAQARNTLEDLKSIGRDKLDQVEQYIEDEPLKAVLIATGLGVLVGALIRR